MRAARGEQCVLVRWRKIGKTDAIVEWPLMLGGGDRIAALMHIVHRLAVRLVLARIRHVANINHRERTT